MTRTLYSRSFAVSTSAVIILSYLVRPLSFFPRLDLFSYLSHPIRSPGGIYLFVDALVLD